VPPELAAALVAVLLALAQLLSVELRIRTAKRERDELALRVADAQHRAGADRRASDPPAPERRA
jgi:hypothetical protein